MSSLLVKYIPDQLTNEDFKKTFTKYGSCSIVLVDDTALIVYSKKEEGMKALEEQKKNYSIERLSFESIKQKKKIKNKNKKEQKETKVKIKKPLVCIGKKREKSPIKTIPDYDFKLIRKLIYNSNKNE